MSNPPVNTVPGAQTIAEDTTLTFFTGNNNLISVSDDVSTTLTVSITATNGRFNLSRTTGLTFSSGRIDAVLTSPGDQAFTFIGTGGFSKIAGQLRYDNGTTDYTRVLGDVNGDGIADFEIRLDWIGANPHILSAADFIL